MKIAVIGYTGSGKSSLAIRLAELYNCPLMHLDKVHFNADWQRRDRQQAYAEIDRFCDLPDWVIEGNYFSLGMDRRFAEADRILFLNCNRFRCLVQALARAYRFRGKQRDDLADGCHDRITPSFLAWILFNGRSGKWLEKYRSIERQYPEKFVPLHTRAEIDAYVEALRKEKEQNEQ